MFKLNGKYYPLKVRVEKGGDCFYLIEENPRRKKEDFIDKYDNKHDEWALSSVDVNLFNLKCFTSFSENSFIEEAIGGDAVFTDETQFSIFGTDRNIEIINIAIYSTSRRSYEEVYVNKEGFYITVEHSILITFYIDELKLQKIKNLLEKNLVKNINCNFSIEIDGIYKLKQYEYNRYYKFLLSDTQIINKEDLPDTFKTVNHKFYELPFSFFIEGNKYTIKNLEEDLEEKEKQLEIKEEKQRQRVLKEERELLTQTYIQEIRDNIIVLADRIVDSFFKGLPPLIIYGSIAYAIVYIIKALID